MRSRTTPQLIDRVMARRYHIDAQGRSVLIGLSHEETREFETLEQASPADADGNPFWSFEGEPNTADERRWLELYRKHQRGWESWTANVRILAPRATARQ